MKEYLKANYDFESKDLVNTYDELSLWAAPFGLKLLEKINYDKHNLTVLDVGCGVGFPLLEIAQRLGASSTVYGLDPWNAALKQLEYKADFYGIKNIKCVHGNAKEIPLENEMFDLIVSNNGLNNTGDELKALSECYRVCKKGGKLIYTVNLPETMREFYTIFKNVLEENGLAKKIDFVQEHIYKQRKSVEELRDFSVGAGFKVVATDMDQFYMRFCDGSAMLNYHFIKMCFLPPWKEIVGEVAMVRIFECLEAKLNAYAEIHHGLNLSIPFVCMVCEKS